MRRTAWIAAGIALLAVLALAGLTQAPKPDSFYRVDLAREFKPGHLLRAEAFQRDVPAGARAWRILYVTTRSDGVPAVASGVVMTRAQHPGQARPVIAWAHGTTGIEPGCAPSLLAPFANVPALDALLDRGWVYVATDYVGLGTRGPHPYLIGEAQARSVLDAVRAARQVHELRVSGSTVVWGHSQGGHAALWTGIIAPAYAPDVPLAGIAAAAPASDLAALVTRIGDTLAGRLTTSYMLVAYDQWYSDVSFGQYARGWKGAAARSIAKRCLEGRSAFGALAAAALVRDRVFADPPVTSALGVRLRENTPTRMIRTPVFIGQGLTDVLVLPDVQDTYVDARCAAGQGIHYVRYPGRDHLSLVAADSPYVLDLTQWTTERILGSPARQGCRAEARLAPKAEGR